MLSAKFFEIPNVNVHEKEKIDMDLTLILSVFCHGSKIMLS